MAESALVRETIWKVDAFYVFEKVVLPSTLFVANGTLELVDFFVVHRISLQYVEHAWKERF